jgi:uncharacterized protein (DUF1697 family)
MARQIALLRAINVGGNRPVPMAQLRDLMAELGYSDVKTYVQSGNVVFTGPDDEPEAVERRLASALADAFGFEIPVMVRTRDELAAVVDANPHRDIATEPKHHHVLFLASEVDPERVADVDREAFAPATFELRGRELYMWTPEGIGRSDLAKALSDKRLGVAATARNWRTVEKLLALADETAQG